MLKLIIQQYNGFDKFLQRVLVYDIRAKYR